MNSKNLLKFSVLFLLGGVIILSNYSPNTYLSGWDNLHPEFNFALNIKRSIFSSWQEYQGLGLLGGMGHASFLPHQIILWIASVIIPQNLIRYAYHFSLLLTGCLGAYFLAKKIFEDKDGENKEAAGIVAAIFYVFNLATLQMFNVPYEAYSTHFAFLPWLFLTFINYLNSSTKKNLIFLTLVNILAVPQGYVGTFFLVYCILLGLFLVFQLKKLKRILIIILITFLTNAFWLLPNLYFVATSSNININSKINLMSTEDNFLKNKKYGGLENTSLLKGFWFDNTELGLNREKINQMETWENYLQNPLVTILGYIIFIICIFGAIYSFKTKTKQLILFLPPAILSFIVISNNTIVLKDIASLFYKIPLFSQIFRFPFTKFAIALSLFLALFYSQAFSSILPKAKKTITATLIFFICIIAPVIFTGKILTGNLFYERVKVSIPSEYFQVFDFFKKQDRNTRIANLPQVSFWGWTLYNWNYTGSGFLWYGIEQPILDRAFDPWSNYNENYYWELSYALYSKNLPLVESVLEKYQINWIILDENVINPTSPKALLFEDTKAMLANSEIIKLEKEFGRIKIYKVNLKTPVKDYLFVSEQLPTVGPKYNWTNLDVASIQKGNYETSESPKYYYPFRSLFTGRKAEEKEFNVTETDNSFIISNNIFIDSSKYKLTIPNKNDLVFVNGQNLEVSYNHKISVNSENGKISVELPKIKGLYSFEQNINNKTVLNLPDHPHNLSYLIRIESKNIKGKSLLFWVENPNLRRSDLETNLTKFKILNSSFYIVPPMERDGLGYTLHFDNISIGDEIAINELGKITVNQIPYNFLTNLVFVKDEGEIQPETYSVNSTHPNPSLYEINIKDLKVGESTIVLSQSFHNGWNAYKVNKNIPGILAPLFGEKIKNHVLINNWENGWKVEKGLLEKDNKIIITFLPQYLEYLGFILLALPFVILFRR